MFPFWEVAVAPVLEAAGVRRLVEIGALRGENTRQIIERLGPQTELHVIDPLPDFDPAEHEREFAGQYVFHRALSLDVLGALPPMDAALIDGDHNWYTVYNELRLLREGARGRGEPLPLLILHDVGWPYGRRDLYYDPSTIPDEFRHEWRQGGMQRGRSRLVGMNGLNPTMCNATAEGGARNGVMTALEDFVDEHDRAMRVVVLPIYFGLAIAAEVERLERQPELAAELDRLESATGKDQLLELAEDVRLEALIFQHMIFYARERSLNRLAQRYLGQVKDGAVGADACADGFDELESWLDTIRDEHILGDLVALGVERPGAALFLAAYLAAYDLDRRLLAMGARQDDRFHSGLERLRLVDERTVELDGSAAGMELPDRVSMLYLGPGAPVGSVNRLYERLSHDGYLVLDEAVEAEVAELVANLCAGDLVVALGPGRSVWRKLVARTETRHRPADVGLGGATTTDRPAPTISPAEALAAAASDVASGRVLDAIERLHQTNVANPQPGVEIRLAALRHEAFDHLEPRSRFAVWPVPVEVDYGAAPQVPQIAPADLSADAVRRAIATHGSAHVPGLLSETQVQAFVEGIERSLSLRAEGAEATSSHDPSWFSPLTLPPEEARTLARSWVAGDGGMLVCDSPRLLDLLFATYEAVGLREVVNEYLGERPALSANKATLRRARLDGGTDWHQDGAFLGTGIRALNVWIALTDCGVDAPGMDLVPRRFEEVQETGTGGAKFDWSVGPDVVSGLAASAPVVRPHFQAGDAMLFDELFLHRTALDPSMTKPRHALESWFFAPSAYPKGQVPLVW